MTYDNLKRHTTLYFHWSADVHIFIFVVSIDSRAADIAHVKFSKQANKTEISRFNVSEGTWSIYSAGLESKPATDEQMQMLLKGTFQ